MPKTNDCPDCLIEKNIDNLDMCLFCKREVGNFGYDMWYANANNGSGNTSTSGSLILLNDQTKI